METVKQEHEQEQRSMTESSYNARTAPSTSTGPKRKSNSCTSQSANNNKRHKTVTSDGPNKNLCKWPGCGKSFPDQANLARHEHIHLDIKPFSCTWPYCHYSAVRKSDVAKHVRIKHFKLPTLKKEQTRLNIVDSRNPEDYVRVDRKLLQGRLA